MVNPAIAVVAEVIEFQFFAVNQRCISSENVSPP